MQILNKLTNNFFSKIFSFRNLFYASLLVTAYFLGDSDLENILSKKLGIDLNIFNKSTGNVSTNYLSLEGSTRTPVSEGVVKSNVGGYLGKYIVNKVVDGDTVHVKDVNEKEDIVRIIAINTLEKNSLDAREKCLANMQTEFTKQNLLGKEVYLFYDATQPKRDKYNRLLNYVATNTVADQSGFINYFYNDYLIQTGNAKIYVASPPAKKYKEYLALQNQAQKENLGMWNTETCKQ
jgi:endonuclease YncB( thermonuclease family)